jgi:hypothetical protein
VKRENIDTGRTIDQNLRSLEEKKAKLAAQDKIGFNLDYVGSIALPTPISQAVRALLNVALDEQIASLKATLEAL